MSVGSRQELIDYCLRRLGAPVITINVDADQVEDRVDEALQYYRQYHYDGTEREIIRVVADADMVAQRAIKLPPRVVSVLRVVPTLTEFEAAMTGSPTFRGSDDLISLNYYYGANTGGFSMESYASYSIQMDVFRYLFRPERIITHRFASGTVTFDHNVPLQVGDVLQLEVYTGVDPDSGETVWNDMWLKEFVTCLIKLQWGSNLIKYSGVQLPTGITLDGRQIYDDAVAEREKLLERLRNEYELPLDFFLG